MQLVQEFVVKDLPAMGFGTPGKISYADKLKNHNPEVMDYTRELITSGECMVEVTDLDDGCMDGRGAKFALWRGAMGEEIQKNIKPGKHSRSKLAGGGYITGLAMKSALDNHDTSVDDELGTLVKTFAEQKVYCGTHTAGTDDEGKTGCGANDNLEAIFHTAIDSFSNIKQTAINVFNAVNMPYNEELFAQVNRGWVATADHVSYFSGSTGESRYKVIMANIAEVQKQHGESDDIPLATSKHLRGVHNEMFEVVNFIEDKTFSQAKLNELLSEKFPEIPEEELPQVFVIDVPRIVKLASAVAKGRKDEEQAKVTALYAGISYQFAAAATLTDGSLPMFLVQEAA